MTAFSLPEKFKQLYIHRKNKDLIEAEIAIDKSSGTVVRTIFRNAAGLTGDILKDGIFSGSQLPEITGDVLRDYVNLSKYLSKNGYKVVNKVKQTKNGIQFG